MATGYAIEALRIFDHLHFRSRMNDTLWSGQPIEEGGADPAEADGAQRQGGLVRGVLRRRLAEDEGPPAVRELKPAGSRWTMPDGRSAAVTDTVRLFTALWPDASVRAQLVALRDAWRWPTGARPVADAHLHATLHFIGSFRRDRLEALRGLSARWRSSRCASSWPAPMSGAAASPSPCSPPSRGVLALQARLGAALAGFGVIVDPDRTGRT